jgi:FkbM family methyltransferase
MQRVFGRRTKLGRSYPPATDEDIEACYRFFLKRPPDPAGRAHFRTFIRHARVDVRQLMQEFLASEEFWLGCHNRHVPQLIRLPGFVIYVRLDDTAVGATIAAKKIYEPHVTDAIVPFLQSGAVFLDIGANVGYFTLLAASRVGDTGEVIAFEPNPDNCRLLKRSIKENSFKNTRLYPYAVAERKQRLRIYPDTSNSTGLVLGEQSQAAAAAVPLCDVRGVVLDEFMKKCKKIDIVKIDIDGGEPHALEGMRSLISRHRPVLFVEFCPKLIEKVSRVEPHAFLDRLSALEYDLFVIGTKGRSDRPQGKQEILDYFAQTNSTHLDLMGRPR